MTDIRAYIMHMYNRDVVGPAPVTEEVKVYLMRGLEGVLNEIDIPANAKPRVVTNPNIVNKPIDYNALADVERDLRYRGETARLAAAFRQQNIHTYGDLVRHITQNLLVHRPTNLRGVRRIRIGKGIGARSLVLLYKHLNAVGINLFESGYTTAELGELRVV